MTDRLEGALAALDEVRVPVTWADVEARLAAPSLPTELRADGVAGRSDPHDVRRRRPAALLALAAAAAALVAGVILAWPGGDGRPRTDIRPAATTAPPAPPTSAPPASAPAPTPTAEGPRVLATTVVGGGRYWVWGGEVASDSTPRRDGFVVDDGARVRGLGDAPIDARSEAAGVWTGQDLIVCCGSGQADGLTADTRSAAAWNPESGRWRTLARPPAGVARSEVAAEWTGEVMVVVAAGPAAATYDPATNTWAAIPAPPELDRVVDAVWTGDEVVVWDARFGARVSPADGAVADRGWRWSPGDEAWAPLPELPVGARTALGSMVWTGGEVVVWGESTARHGLGVGARWRPGDERWAALPPSPQGVVEPFEGTSDSQGVAADLASGRVVVRLLAGNGPEDGGGGTGLVDLAVYDPGADAWLATDIGLAGHHPTMAVLDGQLVVPNEDAPIVAPLTGG